MNEEQVALLEAEFNLIEKELVEKYIQLGMKASGKWEKSLETEVAMSGNKLTAKITGLNYTEQLVFGRRNGRFPPIDAIKQWILDKPINFVESQITLDSLAFLIARKIATEGTKYFQQGGTDLVEAVITPQRIQKILNVVGNSYIQPIVTGLVTQLKNIAKN
jgi:hypothetical protein